jgi:hypothetical protein
MKTEHNGAKNGDKRGKRHEVKAISKKTRRQNDKAEIMNRCHRAV